MITDYFPVIVPITSSEARGGSLQTWDRHTAFRVLASTCMHLRALLYHRSWETKHVAAERLPALIKPPKEVTCPLPVHLIKYVHLPTRTTRSRSSITTQNADYKLLSQDANRPAGGCPRGAFKAMLTGPSFPPRFRYRGRRSHRDRDDQNRVQKQTRLPEHQEGDDPSVRPPDASSVPRHHRARLLPLSYQTNDHQVLPV